ncbi:PIR protein [Plasmodium ovale]|uniref:PIR protein n=1 Tax=Plasmodium ovale TaxID=36330 RepID=A0A1D3JF08_PLAOA|nr:PIR protein [Plasmodium ovale]
MNSFLNSVRISYKIHASTLDDVKIIKALYDDILFFNNAEGKYNFKREIKTCDYCKYFKKSLKKFIEIGKNECNVIRPFVFYNEYNDHLKNKNTINLKVLPSLYCENNANVLHKHKSVHLTEKALMYRIHRVGESDNVILNTDSPLGSFVDDAISGEVNSYVYNIIGDVTISEIPLILFI